MTTTFIRSSECARVSVSGAGEAAEILNKALCGAKNVQGSLRWLKGADRLEAHGRAATHQLIYLMDGDGTIALNGKDYPVGRGAGVYLGPNETAAITATAMGAVKLFHLVVPEITD